MIVCYWVSNGLYSNSTHRKVYNRINESLDIDGSIPQKIDLIKGLNVAVKLKMDGEWYRGTIVKVNGDATCDVRKDEETNMSEAQRISVSQ
jgi:hypothetical protein